ncbi:hypothetical protein [Actinomadura decatromicini]|uniref:Uncharacterized protein n=1 Tax=Actinomadura decatromicini TaxID=2604572 RepID=A0A5D3FAY5_9ACTN|nr:hypothetical protein [Actinomadura decatromicini]TYK45098.1 hypothetical protein FXF68_30925 [Actinomadura decatromicini]
MSAYRTVFTAEADVEVRGLPKRPSVALYNTLVEISRDPWQKTHVDPLKEDESFRFELFDGGDGVVHLQINEEDRIVIVQGITWVG